MKGYLPDWKDVYGDFSNYVEFVRQVFQRSTLLDEDGLKLAISYFFCNSVICNTLPILTCYGPPGSGKSNTGKVMKSLLSLPDTAIKMGGTTTAALRNFIKSAKYEDADCTKEKHCLLIWDDISPAILKQDINLYSILKSGYSRTTDTIDIAGENGSNISFRCFSSKVISTISPFWQGDEFSELSRRIVLLEHRRCTRLPKSFSDVDYCDFSSLKGSRLFDQFWNEERITQFYSYRNELSRVGRELIAGDTLKTLIDLMATAAVLNLFENIDSIIDYFAKQSNDLEYIKRVASIENWLESLLSGVNSISCTDLNRSIRRVTTNYGWNKFDVIRSLKSVGFIENPDRDVWERVKKI